MFMNFSWSCNNCMMSEYETSMTQHNVKIEEESTGWQIATWNQTLGWNYTMTSHTAIVGHFMCFGTIIK